MSIIESGISDIYLITAKIAELKSQSAATGTVNNNANNIDPKLALLNLQQSFNDMLNGLLSSSDNEDDENKTDPLSFLFDSSSQSLTANQTAATANLNVSSYTGLLDL